MMNDPAVLTDIDKPLWNQATYIGRWKHFAFITDCFTVLAPEEELYEAKQLCEEYKTMTEPPGTTVEDIVDAKQLRDSAFHPDTDELMPTIGRMAFQFPGSVLLTTAILKAYKSAFGSVACQLVNQAFYAIVNYTNRNAVEEKPREPELVEKTFACATLASCITTLFLRKVFFYRSASFQRLAPFYAVAAGHMVNLPIMRHTEILHGIPIFADETEETCVMRSSVAAIKAITECALSRMVMTAPAMISIPIIMERVHPSCFYQKRPWIGTPIKLAVCAACAYVAIPAGLAIRPYNDSMKPEIMALLYETEYDDFNERIKSMNRPRKVFYRKGL